jgi:hypothetical protein
MEVTDARRDIAGVRAAHRHDPQMLGAILSSLQKVLSQIIE